MSILRRTHVLAFALVPLMGLGLLAVPGVGTTAAAAASAPPASLGAPMIPAPTPAPGSPAAAAAAADGASNTAADSYNWSGYAASGSTYKSVSSSWVEPGVTCPTTTTSVAGFWVGLDGDGDSTVEQTGTAAECYEGSAVYYAWYEMYPAGSVAYSNTVAPGDVMSASVTAKSATTFVLKISDATQGWSHTTTKTATTAPPRSSAEVITEAPCCTSKGGILPLADFATIHYTKAHVDGASLGSTSPTEIDIVRMAAPHALEDKTSGLSAGGTAFTNTWIRS